MSFKKTTYTDAGVQMLTESLSGAALTISGVVGGAGTWSDAELPLANGVSDPRQNFALMGIESVPGETAKQVNIQITNKGLRQSYILRQVGIYAKMSYDSSETLIVIMQDDRGIEIPAESDNADFKIELGAVLAISNSANITVKVDSSAGTSLKQVQDAIAKHDADLNAHGGMRAELHEETVKLAARVSKLELETGDISSNLSFAYPFTNLDGLIVSGIWNSEQGRMEF